MRRVRTHHLLILVAMLHLLADAALAGEAVLCVGADDHQEIEAGHTGVLCHPAEAESRNPTGLQAAESAPDDCTDRLLHSASAEMTSEHSDGSDLEPPALSLPSLAGEANLLEFSSLRAAGSSDPPPPGLVAHRTIVLLI